jgi:pyruvate dehydrogenase E1 component alpha subunit
MGGSMHIFLKSIVFMVTGVGGQIQCRISFADKYFETGGVTMTYFGDGAARQGSLHEAFNMAMLWKLQLFYCGEQWLRWEHQ